MTEKGAQLLHLGNTGPVSVDHFNGIRFQRVTVALPSMD